MSVLRDLKIGEAVEACKNENSWVIGFCRSVCLFDTIPKL